MADAPTPGAPLRGNTLDEFALIDLILAEQPPSGGEVLVAAGDDAAVIAPPAGEDLVVTVDTLVEGIHFVPGLAPTLVAHRALAVSLSDLAAMGARPGPCLLALTHPALTPKLASALGRGFAQAAAGTGASLVGGNLAQGPFTLSVTGQGWVPQAAALRRSGARPGELVCVSGVLGAGAAGLAAVRADTIGLPAGDADVLPDALPNVLRPYLTPTPRLELGMALRGLASACIDVSDGLLADLRHLARASGVRAELDLDQVPVIGDPQQAVVAGDDYELLFTVPPGLAGRVAEISRALALPLTVIGEMTTGEGLGLHMSGVPMAEPAVLGWSHFS